MKVTGERTPFTMYCCIFFILQNTLQMANFLFLVVVFGNVQGNDYIENEKVSVVGSKVKSILLLLALFQITKMQNLGGLFHYLYHKIPLKYFMLHKVPVVSVIVIKNSSFKGFNPCSR